jgi:hypothetical protein
MSACGVSRTHRRSRRLAYGLARRVSPNAGLAKRFELEKAYQFAGRDPCVILRPAERTKSKVSAERGR